MPVAVGDIPLVVSTRVSAFLVNLPPPPRSSSLSINRHANVCRLSPGWDSIPYITVMLSVAVEYLPFKSRNLKAKPLISMN